MDSGSDDNLRSNYEFKEKGNQRVLFCDHVNGLEQQGIASDSFVMDMERFEKDINSKSRITVSLICCCFLFVNFFFFLKNLLEFLLF